MAPRKTRIQAQIAKYFWWPRWTVDAETYIKNCSECRNSDRTKVTHEEPLHPVSLPEEPWEKVAVDMKGPLQKGRYK